MVISEIGEYILQKNKVIKKEGYKHDQFGKNNN